MKDKYFCILFSTNKNVILCNIYLTVTLCVGIIPFPGHPSGNRIRFDDSRVCKSFLVSCCPHDILSGTVRTF